MEIITFSQFYNPQPNTTMFKTTITLLSLAAALLTLAAFQVEEHPAAGPYPKKIDAIIQAKCYGCHSADGRSQKAKDALMWDEMEGLNAEQRLEKIHHIQEVLSERSMPPARFLESNPDKALTDKERAKMLKWANKLERKLSK